MFAPLHGRGYDELARLAVGATFVLLALAGCGGNPQAPVTLTQQTASPVSGDVSQARGSAASAQDDPDRAPVIGATHDTVTTAGHYLAARQALYFNDVGQSADFFLRTLEDDASNVALLRQAFLTQYYYGDIEQAAALGRQLEGLNVVVPLGGEPATALALRNADWPASIVLADRIAEDGQALAMAGVIRGWSLVAAGQGDAGISALLEAGRMSIDVNSGMPPFFRLHAALMAERLGLINEALQRVTGLDADSLPSHVALDLAAFYARRQKWDIVDRLIDTQLSRQFNQTDVRAALEQGARELPAIQQHIAAAVVALALSDNKNSGQSLAARLRFALFVDDDHHFARLLLAQQLSDYGQTDIALANLERIPDGGMFGQLARLAESAVVEEAGDSERSISLMKAVADRDPGNAYLFHRLGDTYRRNSMFRQSRDAYMASLALGRDTGGLHRSLGVSLERLGETQAAETHLLRAIEIDPGDAYALNYLGYWWADEGRKLDQAIAMIERAVSHRPSSGFFVDSLGWVHYKLGDPARAVGYLERATELEPSDPEITGHLGDVYWALGRREEAMFKWRLALTLSDDAEEQALLERRLRTGLTPEEMPGSN
jgi:tetratricopeptide (TPR) repeat protein